MSRRRELADELARELGVDIEDLLVAIDRVRTSTNPRRRAADAISSPLQTTLQGRNRAPRLDGRPHLHAAATLDSVPVADGGGA